MITHSICKNKVLLYPCEILLVVVQYFGFMLEQLLKITNSRLTLSDESIQMMVLCKLDRNYTQKVKKLVLGSNGTTQEIKRGINVEHLISLSRFDWSFLIELNMWNSKLGAKGCKYLSRAQLPKLETLDLGNNQIDRNGVLHLCKASFGQLIELDLSVNTITAESVHWLLRLNQSHLKKIWIRKNKIPLNDLLKFVLQQRKIAHLSVYENEIEKYSNAQLDQILHQKFGDANINV